MRISICVIYKMTLTVFQVALLQCKMSLVVRKPAFCICENKDADQLPGNREADQRICFRYTDSTIPLLPKTEISGLLPYSVAVQPGLCRTWSETPKTGFLTTRLRFSYCMDAGSISNPIARQLVELPSIASQAEIGRVKLKSVLPPHRQISAFVLHYLLL